MILLYVLHFSPYWLSMKVLCRGALCHMLVMHLILPFYISMWCVHVCHRLGTGWLSTSHGSCWPLPNVVPVLCHVSCTHALWFLHGKEVLLCMWCECFYCYQFCRKMDLAYWKLILSAWHPIRWRLTNTSLKHLHVVFLQLYKLLQNKLLGICNWTTFWRRKSIDW